MTVLTKVKVLKKEDEPAQTRLVGGEADGVSVEDAAAGEDEVDADAVRYMLLSRRARRINGSSICILTGLLTMFSLCLVGGLFYYRQAHQSERLHAWCSIPYEGETDNTDLLWDSPKDVEVFDPKEASERVSADGDVADRIQELPMFREEFDIDVERNTEAMFVPEFEGGQSAHFFSDFDLGQTAIMPVDSRICMMFELDTTEFMEPEPLAVRVRRFENGMMDGAPVTISRQVLSIRTPAITGMESISINIQQACVGRPIFQLEKRSVFKRSAEGEAGAKFAVFGGRHIIQYTITNMAEVE